MALPGVTKKQFSDGLSVVCGTHGDAEDLQPGRRATGAGASFKFGAHVVSTTTVFDTYLPIYWSISLMVIDGFRGVRVLGAM